MIEGDNSYQTANSFKISPAGALKLKRDPLHSTSLAQAEGHFWKVQGDPSASWILRHAGNIGRAFATGSLSSRSRPAGHSCWASEPLQEPPARSKLPGRCNVCT
eukprot:jgi/Botrbrau1/1190/Bobra.0163s0004.1